MKTKKRGRPLAAPRCPMCGGVMYVVRTVRVLGRLKPDGTRDVLRRWRYAKCADCGEKRVWGEWQCRDK